MLDEHDIRADRVAHVREIAPRIEIADPKLRIAASRLDFGDLAREAGGDERWILTRTEMIERPRDDDVDAVGHRAAREQLLRQLADPVRALRHERMILGERLIGRSVHHRGARYEEPRLEAR